MQNNNHTHHHDRHVWLAIAAAIVLLLLCSACSPKVITNTQYHTDSVRVEYREKVRYKPDTVYLEIPAQTAQQTTPDTASLLENDYAESNARINPDGSLYHDLKTKPQKKPIPTEKEIIEREIFEHCELNNTDHTEEVKIVRHIPPFYRRCTAAFWLLLLAAVAYFTIKIYRKFRP